MNPNFTGTMLEYRVWKFPSGELGLAITSFQRMQVTPMHIVGSVQSSDHIMELLLLVNALRVLEGDAMPIHLVMPYCAYSRQDRVCNPGESLSIKVFAQLINSCNFASVACYDNHSDVSTALIKNCTSIDLWTIFERWGTDNLNKRAGLRNLQRPKDRRWHKNISQRSSSRREYIIRTNTIRPSNQVYHQQTFQPSTTNLSGWQVTQRNLTLRNTSTTPSVTHKSLNCISYQLSPIVAQFSTDRAFSSRSIEHCSHQNKEAFMPSQDIKEVLVEALMEILAPKKDKKAKTSPKYVMVIDGKVMQSRPGTKAEVLSAAQAIIIRRPEAKIEVYKFHSNLAINLPVAGMETDVETEVEGE